MPHLTPEREKKIREKIHQFYATQHEGILQPEIIESSTEWLTNLVLNLVSQELTHALAKKDEEYSDIFAWLLGEKGDFPNLAEKPHYRFRTKLREMLSTLNLTNQK